MSKRKANPPPPMDSDDDAPEEVVSSKAPPGFEAPVATSSSKKPRTRRVRAREEKYWAEKQQQEDGAGAAAKTAGDGGNEEQQEGEEQGERAAEEVLAEAAAVSARGGPLSAELLERVARAKEAERARRVHEALAVVEMARRREQAQQRKLKASQPKAPHVFGNIKVATLGALEREDDREVPDEVLAFARTNGEQGRKRVPFTSFTKQKAKAVTTGGGTTQRPRKAGRRQRA